jgi:uncharacterized membrane protein YgcG
MVLGQRFRLERISRIDPITGIEKALVKGDLSQVDQYKWADSNTLRWRSRIPGSPLFHGTEIDYVIEYTLSHILDPRDSTYLLDHDFAFPERSWVIHKYSLTLEFDPAWKPLQDFVEPTEIGPLNPGDGYVVTLPLDYQNPGRPAAVRFGAAASIRYVILLALLASLVLLLLSFYGREEALGRFEPLVPSSSIDEGWLKDNLLQMSPELAGTIWDEAVGSVEVAAVLARLVAEGKLKSEIRRGRSKIFSDDVLYLKILDRNGLKDYEEDLLQSLFFDGGDETDTDRIKEHYKTKGFDPSSKIRKPLEKLMKELINPADNGSRPSWKFTFGFALAGMTLFAAGFFAGVYEIVTGLIAAAVILILYLPSRIMAGAWQRRLVNQGAHFVALMLPLAVLAGLIGGALATGVFRIGALALGGVSLLCIAVFSSALNSAKTRENPEQIRFRKKLAAAREYFRIQLMNLNPVLQDAWYPYLVAFGLGKSVDRWFRAYGKQVSTAGPAMDSLRSTGTSTHASSTPTWTGGGGAFGGGGASGSWATVAGSMAAGVSAPSSRSGGGRGGGRSGGGGGGGW